MAQVPARAGADGGDVRLRPAQARVVEAALALFAEHGVSGTSLQMIADAIGVTKAAVYHQFRTKEEIVLAVALGPLRTLEAALDMAERAATRQVALELILDRLVGLAVEHRRIVGNLQGDPVMARFVAEHELLRSLQDRLDRLLLGDDGSDAARVRTAMLTTAVTGAVVHPLVTGLDDEALRRHLVDHARRFLGLPDGA
jgi:AcrR family transcriptional regulator